MAPTWLTVVAWIALATAVASAMGIAADVVRGYRQDMAVMNVVWPVTALYAGPAALWLYGRYGRTRTERWRRERAGERERSRPAWTSTALDVSHCGAGCTLGDIVAETAVLLLGLTIAGQALYAEFAADYLVAVLLGIVFQYFAIAPMRGLSLWPGLAAATKADILSLSAFEVGLFGWMALMWFVLFPDPHLTPTSPVYWFLMQIGMLIGFATSWPANVWLVRRGIKEAM